MPYQHGFDSYYGVPYSVDMGLAYVISKHPLSSHSLNPHWSVNVVLTSRGDLCTNYNRYNNRTPETSFEDDYYGCTPLPLVANETVLEQPTDLAGLNAKYSAAATSFLQQVGLMQLLDND